MVARWPRIQTAAAGTAVAAVLLAACATSVHLGHWRNSISVCSRALAVTGPNPRMHVNLALALKARGQGQDFQEAEAYFLQALGLRPRLVEAHYGLGDLYLRTDRPELAADSFQAAIEIAPLDHEAHYCLAQALLRQGQLAGAAQTLNTALRIEPADARSHHLLARVREEQGDVARAVRHYESAIELEPERPEFLNDLAWLLATHADARVRDGSRALALAERASAFAQLQIPAPPLTLAILSTLAAAHAERGEFEAAVRFSKVAVQGAAGREPFASILQQRLERYEAKKPFRQHKVVADATP